MARQSKTTVDAGAAHGADWHAEDGGLVLAEVRDVEVVEQGAERVARGGLVERDGGQRFERGMPVAG